MPGARDERAAGSHLGDEPARLSNGRYGVAVGARGESGSACDGNALTLPLPGFDDPAEGFLIYVRDLETGEVWTACGRPLPGGDPGRISLDGDGTSGASVALERERSGIASRVGIDVLPDVTAELRRLSLVNHAGRARRLEVTSCVEVALAPAAAHAAHPVFSKLFLQTEKVAGRPALLARRRPRADGERPPWLVHAIAGAAGGWEPATFTFETDRARFLGRMPAGGVPRALRGTEPLSGAVGSVLDPVLALRCVVALEPGGSAELTLLLGAGDDREAAVALASRFGSQGVAWPEPGPAATAPAPMPEPAPRPAPASVPPSPPESAGNEPLGFPNAYGGFSPDGSEYVIRLRRRRDGGLAVPPRPWINVVANEQFGFLVSETGAGYTWHGNSREHRLTPWSNDPLRDPPGEAFWVRDEESGRFWSALPGPTPGGDYEMRHGWGYSVCRHAGEGIGHETTLFAARRDPVRCTAIRLTNASGRPRRLALYGYYRLVLGHTPRETGTSVVTTRGKGPGLLLARNPDAGCFAGAVAFAAVVPPRRKSNVAATADAEEFLGPEGSLERPAAVAGGALPGGRTGSGLHPCFAQRVAVALAPGETAEVAFLLGEVPGTTEPGGSAAAEAAALDLVARWSEPGAVAHALAEARDFWRTFVSGVTIATPSRALDLMVNGWLPYQTLSCRIWGRSAFYQSGGAFGYRDQLQDAAALAPLDPRLTRAQIVLHAGHQFVEGDVLHWWHTPDDRGLRTKFADDLLWLPYATAGYLAATGDEGVLDEVAPYLTAPLLTEGQDEAFLTPRASGEAGNIYDHCCRAIDRGVTTGVHGLPLFGCGDWNDGMNRVGRLGRGESVWMGFFLYAVLDAFAPVCERRGDAARADRYRRQGEAYRRALNGQAWDGEWYRRGWYDDGDLLGSRESDECRIDALAQAWAVISGAAPRDRVAASLDAVEEHLISGDERLIRLFTPPFDTTRHDPGYIKGYVPGVRENGGQYTHAACWIALAMAEAGRRDRAAALLELLNPIMHAFTPERLARYQVEPYVICADVYGAPPHVGRGGWTWYTGSSGWYWRVAVESVLGIRLEGGARLVIDPRVPDEWPEFSVEYRLPDVAAGVAADAPGAAPAPTTYAIRVVNPRGRAERVTRAVADGEPMEIAGGAAIVPVARDGRRHVVEIELG